MHETSIRTATGTILGLACWILLLSVGNLRGQVSSASMAGVVTGADGTPIDSVVVMYVLGPGLSSGGSPPSGGMLAGTDGTFAFSNLAPGLYYVCAYAPPQKSVLDSCEWTLSPQTVTLITGQNLTGLQIVLQPGVRLQLRVNDLTNIIGVPVLRRTGKLLQTNLFDAAGLGHMIPLRSFDSTGFNYEMVVPAAMPLTMQFGGTGLTLADSKGTTVPFQGVSRPVVQIPSGSAPTLLTFSVGPVAVTPAPAPAPTP